MKNDLEKYLKQQLLVDTRSSFLYIGILEAVTEHCAVLSQVDVHDSKETITTKELYAIQSKTTGVKINRELVYINLDHVVSFSPLDAVKSF